MNELKIFTNSEFGQIRTVTIENEPWFVGKDVAEALAYKDSFGALKKHVDSEDKQNCQNDSFNSQRGMIIINESGLYSLIMGSKLETAKKFKRWVTKEVLPSIRRHGAYATDEVINNILENPDFGIQLFTNLKQEKEQNKFLNTQLQEKSQLIEQMQPKASYYDLILQCQDVLTTTEIAKDYGMSAKAFNKLLKEYHIQFHQSGRWFLYAQYDGNGYTQSRTQPITHWDGTRGYKSHMYWTQKGRLFLYETLKKHEIVPVIEN